MDYIYRFPERPLILVVEDSSADRELIKRAFAKSDYVVTIHASGEAALDFIRDRMASEKRLPSLIITDFNMPRMTGPDFVRRLREDCDVLDVPVVTFTSSDHEGDIHSSYSAGCYSYVVKPLGNEDFRAALLNIARYWIEMNESIVPPPIRLD